jgi:predicted dithiol-disulfide oxidoreductase (DUF899 family)
VVELRRALRPGGVVSKDYRFEGENGPVVFSTNVNRMLF